MSNRDQGTMRLKYSKVQALLDAWVSMAKQERSQKK